MKVLVVKLIINNNYFYYMIIRNISDVLFIIYVRLIINRVEKNFEKN